MWIYTAIVRSMLAYGAAVWWPKFQQTTARQKFSQVQRTACLSITMRTTSTIVMENEVVRKTPLLQADTDSISPRFAFDKPYTVLTKRQEETARRDVISVFTDGSKRKEGAGCGIYSRSLHIRYKWAMDRHATVVQTELAGITIAAKEIARRHTTGKTIRIYADSRQALLTLRNHKIMTRTVWECHQALVVASASNSISVCWIKGHERCNGNKKADKLAKSASSLNIFGSGSFATLPTTPERQKSRGSFSS
ncbi:uncharacterized protein LOC108903295 [Anoplophora glabripennis]|uniref:uncharacterized protein LOC108903295 n=1 Tax=Anoplophora glabripennis TaxID=217634 RepID=UPI000874AA7C|nr:uncharacterized protein LOC108903295 [Anoplophora glabripennis]